MKDYQFGILMSGMFLIASDITDSISFLIMSILWIVMTALYVFSGRKDKA